MKIREIEKMWVLKLGDGEFGKGERPGDENEAVGIDLEEKALHFVDCGFRVSRRSAVAKSSKYQRPSTSIFYGISERLMMSICQISR